MSRLLALLVGLAATASAELDWRSFENADKTKSFQGRLVGYNPSSRKVTVQKKTTLRPVTFSVSLLSAEHQKYVEDRAVELEAAGGVV